MILTIDIGNTTISFALLKNKQIIKIFQVNTDVLKTQDEYGSMLIDMFNQNNLNSHEIKASVISSVVIGMESSIGAMIQKTFGVIPIIIGPGIKSGIDIKIKNPKELGTDLLANCVGAKAISLGPFVVIDFGTATSLSIVNEINEFIGVSILPGIQMQLDVLAQSASKLPVVTAAKTIKIIGQDSEESILSGVIIGQAQAINGLIKQISKNFTNIPTIFVTGGHAWLIIEHLHQSYQYQENLIHYGLWEIGKRNK